MPRQGAREAPHRRPLLLCWDLMLYIYISVYGEYRSLYVIMYTCMHTYTYTNHAPVESPPEAVGGAKAEAVPWDCGVRGWVEEEDGGRSAWSDWWMALRCSMSLCLWFAARSCWGSFVVRESVAAYVHNIYIFI